MGLNLKGLVILSFLATVGATLLVLGCALADYNWWPVFVVIFYVLSPLPILISRRVSSGDGFSSDSLTGRCFEVSVFITTVLVVSAYALPIVMAHTPLDKSLIKWSSAAFIFAGNTIIFITIAIFVRILITEDNYGGW